MIVYTKKRTVCQYHKKLERVYKSCVVVKVCYFFVSHYAWMKDKQFEQEIIRNRLAHMQTVYIVDESISVVMKGSRVVG